MQTGTVYEKLHEAYEALRAEFWGECSEQIGEKRTEKIAGGLEKVFFKKFSAEVQEALRIIFAREKLG